MRAALHRAHRCVNTGLHHERCHRVVIAVRRHLADPREQQPHILSPTALMTLRAVFPSQARHHRILKPGHDTPLMHEAATLRQQQASILLRFLPAVSGTDGCNFLNPPRRASVGSVGVEGHLPQLSRCGDGTAVCFLCVAGNRGNGPGVCSLHSAACPEHKALYVVNYTYSRFRKALNAEVMIARRHGNDR